MQEICAIVQLFETLMSQESPVARRVDMDCKKGTTKAGPRLPWALPCKGGGPERCPHLPLLGEPPGKIGSLSKKGKTDPVSSAVAAEGEIETGSSVAGVGVNVSKDSAGVDSLGGSFSTSTSASFFTGSCDCGGTGEPIWGAKAWRENKNKGLEPAPEDCNGWGGERSSKVNSRECAAKDTRMAKKSPSRGVLKNDIE